MQRGNFTSLDTGYFHNVMKTILGGQTFCTRLQTCFLILAILMWESVGSDSFLQWPQVAIEELKFFGTNVCICQARTLLLSQILTVCQLLSPANDCLHHLHRDSFQPDEDRLNASSLKSKVGLNRGESNSGLYHEEGEAQKHIYQWFFLKYRLAVVSYSSLHITALA